jgi:HK97 family phage prohead protease
MTTVHTRSMVLERKHLDAQAKTIPASLSSTAPYAREYGQEVLLHTPAAVDMSRAANGLPLLYSHDRTAIIGRVEGIRLDGDKMRGLLRFSDNPQATEVWRDVEAGILTDLSVGYSIQEIEPGNEPGVFHVTRWTPFEASIVSVPADHTVGINRSLSTQSEKEIPMQASLQEIRQAASVVHLDRRDVASFETECVARGLTALEATRLACTKAAVRDESHGIISSSPENFGSPSGRIGLMAEALAARAGGPAASDEAREFLRMSPVDMARSLLEDRGIHTRRLSTGEIMQRAMATTSDFPQLLVNSGNRILQNAYGSYKGGLKRIAHQSTVADFRAKQVLKLGEMPSLEKVNEHGEYTYGTPTEAKESYSLSTYGRIFAITRQALINDDLDAFASVISRFGVSAAEREATQLVSLLTGNPTMADGTALFHANHGNLAASGAVISVATLGAARKAMRLQTGLDGKTAIDVTPSFLIVPAALETVAEQFLATLSPTVSSESNPFSGRLELVVDPRLDAASTTAWYLAATPTAGVETIEYAYLEGFVGPQVEVRDGWEVDGTEIKCRLDFGCGVIDHRGLYKNPGA